MATLIKVVSAAMKNPKALGSKIFPQAMIELSFNDPSVTLCLSRNDDRQRHIISKTNFNHIRNLSAISC